MDGTLSVEPFDPPGICELCHRTLSSDSDPFDLESFIICGDCKFLFLEDSGTPSQDIQQRIPRVRRTRYTNSSESIENMFSTQFSTMINLARRSQPAVSELDNQSVDSVQRTSSRTTPSGSRRWRRVLSDTESDGFDSVYGESDAISYGAYGGDSDASVDVHSYIGDSDTDIDPMHAGLILNQWSSDDEDDEWEEVEPGENTLGSLIARVQLQRSLESNGQNPAINWETEIEGGVRVRISEGRHVHIPNPFGHIEDQERSPFVGHSGDYLDARSFEELVERLAEADNSRRGAPPAAVSVLNNLERVVVNDADHNGSACAICKDLLSVGTVVNRLPCLHLYHPSCIKPWLSARNSCPLCRYELPTDDMEYENRKQSGSRVQETEQQEEEDAVFEEDEAPEVVNDGGGRGTGGGRWLFVAAPVVTLVGVALALWLGNRGAIRSSGSCSSGQRGHRSRRWWSLF